MTNITLSLTPALLERLKLIAGEKELSLDECAEAALRDYIESWEDFSRTVQALESGEEERIVLRAVGEH
jgi:predicted transcriptional regulator